ncbi:MAG: pilus assembly protein [Alcaligenaceae bacterium]|nr:pilus assembly protein [Alcaligenaceae bacterium]
MKRTLQSGQALAEGLVVMLVLLLFFVGIAWLGRLLDMGLQASHASHYGAFQLGREIPDINKAELASRFLLGQEKNWRDRRGNLLLNSDAIAITVDRTEKLNAFMQPGSNHAQASLLRKDWQIEDPGMARLSLSLTPLFTAARKQPDSKAALGLGLDFFDHFSFSIKRHTSILTGAGHAASDQAAHAHTSLGREGWQNAASLSYASGRKIQSFSQSVDAPWDRPKPVLDWLQPWQGMLPAHHLEQ